MARKLKAVKNEPAPLEASVPDAKALAQNWTDQILQCRSGLFNHEFQPFTATYNGKYKIFYVVLRCKVCTTKKHYEMTQTGKRIGSSWYTYPPGYLAQGIGRIIGDAKDVVRLEAVNRLLSVAKMTAKEAREDQPRPSTLALIQGGQE